METSDGHLLGGRLHYAQPIDGYRTGIEPVLLAASVPARPGQRVLEAGTGAGAGLMCLAARVPGVFAIGIEIDPDMAALARRNIEANGFSAVDILTGDVAGIELPRVDHVMANPPWHASGSTASPLARRRLAKQERAGLEVWISALAKTLLPEGSLTLIVAASQVGRAETALAAHHIGMVCTHMLLPKADRPAKLALVQARQGRASCVARSIVLHDSDGRFTPAIEQVLRGGGALFTAD